MEELIGSGIGFGITALLFLAGALPIYFILKKISGSKTTFAEDLKELYTARHQPRPKTLRMLSALDSVESGVLEVYKYVLILGLVVGSVFIVWFFLNVQNDSERSFLRLYFGAGYLFLVVWVVGSLAMIKRRQARSSHAGMTQLPNRASVDPAPPPGVKAAPSKDAPPEALTVQQIVFVVMVFVFAVGTFSVILFMLQGLPSVSR